MRTPILAAFLGLTLVACVGSVPGSPGTGGTGGGGGVAGGGGGTGGGGGGGEELDAFVPPPVPAVAVTVDHETISTDLGVEAKIIVTATGSMGFSGPVTFAVTAVDSTGTAIADWAPAIDNTSITLTENGTGTANITLNLAGDVTELMGTIKIAGTSTAVEADASVAVTANPQLDVIMADTQGKCVYFTPNAFSLKLGRSIAVYNASTATPPLGLIVHSDGNLGFAHENVNGTPTAFGQAYVQTPNATGTDKFGCHTAGNNVMADPGNYPTLTVVN